MAKKEYSILHNSSTHPLLLLPRLDLLVFLWVKFTCKTCFKLGVTVHQKEGIVSIITHPPPNSYCSDTNKSIDAIKIVSTRVLDMHSERSKSHAVFNANGVLSPQIFLRPSSIPRGQPHEGQPHLTPSARLGVIQRRTNQSPVDDAQENPAMTLPCAGSRPVSV
ncbi:Nodulin-like [Musa troglodytarum]|uniref:Nodulin-like n=1 Tax=Musa troglodytarum TaxID=320322 RepID=A0A9E7H684_9LILI|nr:Nodulin-like [Musa troglodytarum]